MEFALKNLQEQMQEAITRSDFLSHVATNFEDHILETPPIPTDRRISIYSDAWFIRLHNSLKEDFQSVADQIGEEAFVKLVRQYLTRFPSRSYSLASLGDQMAEFLQDSDYGTTHPWLTDLAQLEIYEYQSFYAADSKKFNPRSLAELTEAEQGQVQLQLSPSSFILASAFEVLPLWNQKHTNAPTTNPTFLVLYRKGSSSECMELTKNEFKLLELLKKKKTLEELIPYVDETLDFGRCLNEWATLGIITVIEKTGDFT